MRLNVTFVRTVPALYRILTLWLTAVSKTVHLSQMSSFHPLTLNRDTLIYYPPLYAFIFQVVSSFQDFKPEFYRYFSSLPSHPTTTLPSCAYTTLITFGRGYEL
jgi:hypothetical protein